MIDLAGLEAGRELMRHRFVVACCCIRSSTDLSLPLAHELPGLVRPSPARCRREGFFFRGNAGSLA